MTIAFQLVQAARLRAAEIEILHVVARAQRRRVLLVRRHAVFEHDRAMRVSERDRGILLGDEDREPFLLVEPLQRPKNVLDDERREAHRRLVEGEQPRFGHQRAADGEHLLLAARGKPGGRAPALARAWERTRRRVRGLARSATRDFRGADRRRR